MAPKKQTKAERIRELKRQLVEAQAQQIHNYCFASAELASMGIGKCMGSAVILTLTTLVTEKPLARWPFVMASRM